MNSPIETGLFLPIRFYETLAEQDRFKRISEGVAMVDELYVYADCDKLLPFQIVFPEYNIGLSLTWRIICLTSNDTTELPVDYDYWEFYTDLTSHWISYLGKQSLSGFTSNGRHYLEVTIIDNLAVEHTYYSDIFVINNCDSFYETDDYRIVSTANNQKRAVDVTDLRITKQ